MATKETGDELFNEAMAIMDDPVEVQPETDVAGKGEVPLAEDNDEVFNQAMTIMDDPTSVKPSDVTRDPIFHNPDENVAGAAAKGFLTPLGKTQDFIGDVLNETAFGVGQGKIAKATGQTSIFPTATSEFLSISKWAGSMKDPSSPAEMRAFNTMEFAEVSAEIGLGIRAIAIAKDGVMGGRLLFEGKPRLIHKFMGFIEKGLQSMGQRSVKMTATVETIAGIGGGWSAEHLNQLAKDDKIDMEPETAKFLGALFGSIVASQGAELAIPIMNKLMLGITRGIRSSVGGGISIVKGTTPAGSAAERQVQLHTIINNEMRKHLGDDPYIPMSWNQADDLERATGVVFNTAEATQSPTIIKLMQDVSQLDPKLAAEQMVAKAANEGKLLALGEKAAKAFEQGGAEAAVKVVRKRIEKIEAAYDFIIKGAQKELDDALNALPKGSSIDEIDAIVRRVAEKARTQFIKDKNAKYAAIAGASSTLNTTPDFLITGLMKSAEEFGQFEAQLFAHNFPVKHMNHIRKLAGLEEIVVKKGTAVIDGVLKPVEIIAPNSLREFRSGLKVTSKVTLKDLAFASKEISKELRKVKAAGGNTDLEKRLVDLLDGVKSSIKRIESEAPDHIKVQIMEAKDFFKKGVSKLRNGMVYRILRKNKHGESIVADGEIARMFFQSGQKATGRGKDFVRAFESEAEAMGALRDFAYRDLAKFARDADGLLKPEKIAQWLKRYQDVLDIPQFSAIKAEVESLVVLKEAGEGTIKIINDATDKLNRMATASLMHADVKGAVKGIFAAKDSGKAMLFAMRALKNDKAALSGLKSQVWNEYFANLVTRDPATKRIVFAQPDDILKFINEKSIALGHLFKGDDHLKTIKSMAFTVKRIQNAASGLPPAILEDMVPSGVAKLAGTWASRKLAIERGQISYRFIATEWVFKNVAKMFDEFTEKEVMAALNAVLTNPQYARQLTKEIKVATTNSGKAGSKAASVARNIMMTYVRSVGYVVSDYERDQRRREANVNLQLGTR